MKAVIYARYSSDSQTENSIEGQLRECKAFAERQGITVVDTYIDRAYSAKTDNRPQFQKMIKDSVKANFEIIIVWKLDRFARNRYDSATYKAKLKKHGVKVVSATEPISQDSTGILLESLLEGYAEFFSAELAEKVKRGHKENAIKRKWNGGGKPIGYYVDEDRYLKIDPVTSPFALEAFKRYDEGAKVVEIVDWLNENQIKTYRNCPVSINSIQRMLKNRAYIGEYHYGEHIFPDGIPALVPIDLFNRVQEKIAKNKKAPARHKAEDDYLLTTKLYCGKCNSYMVGESGTGQPGRVYHYYKCVSVKKHRGCDKKSIRKDKIENLVIEQTMKMLADEKIIEGIADMILALQKQENTTLPYLRKQLAEIERGIENMLNAIQKGVVTSSTKKRLEDLEKSREEIEVRIIKEELKTPILTREQILFWLHKFRNMDVTKQEQRQRLIDTFINAVFLYDDKIVLTFNYKEGSKTVKLSDVKKMLKSVNNSDLTTFGRSLSASRITQTRPMMASKASISSSLSPFMPSRTSLSKSGHCFCSSKKSVKVTPKYSTIANNSFKDGNALPEEML